MSVRVKVIMKVSKAAIEKMTRSPNGMVGSGLRRMSRVAEARAKQNIINTGRIESGEMLRTTHALPIERTSKGIMVSIVSPQRYARFQEHGTRYITPARFMSDALESLKLSDFTGGI